MNFLIVLLPLFLISMLGDLYGRIKDNNKIVAVFQPGTTSIVILIALSSLGSNIPDRGYTLHIVLALIVAMVADAILVDRSNPKGFIRGMALFLVTLLIYGYTWTKYNGFHSHDLMMTLIFLVFYLGLVFFFTKHMYKDQRKPNKLEYTAILVYLLVFCMVISRSVLTFYGDFFTFNQSLFMTIGIVLFFLGDCQLGIYHFIDVNFPMIQAPPFYFVGQLLIALSCSL